MSPSIDNALGMEACRKAVDKREKLKPSVDCIMEAIELTLPSMGNIYKNTVLQWDLRMPAVMLISVYLKSTTKC